MLAAIGFTLYLQHLLKQAENKEKSPGPGGKASGEKEVILRFKASGQTQSIPQEAQEHPGEHSKATRSAKSTFAGKEGKAREDEEAVKAPHRQAPP